MAKQEQPETKKSNPDTPAGRRSLARQTAIVVGIALGMTAVALFLWYSVQVLLLAFAAVLIAVALRGMSNWVADRTGLPGTGALVVVILSVIGLFVVLGVLLAPSVTRQFERLAERLPQSVQSAQDRLRQYEWGRKILGEGPALASGAQAEASDDNATPRPGESVVAQALQATTQPSTIGNVARYARQFFEAIFTLVLVMIVGIYLAAQPTMHVEGLLMLFPKAERPRLRDVVHTVGRTLQHWLLGQLVPMLAIGVLIGAGLKLIGVPLWLPLGILAALLNFIPNFGPIIAAAPAILIALADSPVKALWVVVLCIAAQNLEGYLITPLVQKKAVQMPPALTILSQVLFGLLLGPLGLVLAAPLTAAAIVVIKMLYVEDTLATKVSGLPTEPQA